jgi:hypothetical protein
MQTLTITMPRAPGSTSPEITIDLSKVYQALGRIEEIASLSPTKAPELMTTFNKAYLILGKYSNLVLLEKNKTKSSMDRVRSLLLVDKVPAILLQKHLKDNKSNIDAICELDPEYAKNRDVLDKLTALYELMKHHLKSLEMAYTGAKKQLGEHNANLIDFRSELSGVNELQNQLSNEESSPMVGLRQSIESFE